MAEYEYNVNGTLAKMTYTNSDYVLYSYDLLDRLISEVYYNHNHVAVAEYHYVYNANGQLAKQYVTQNGKVVRDTVTNASTGAFQYILDFTYDESGSPFALRKYTNSSLTSYCTYYYGCNAQGDVVTLFTGNGNIYATYSYDAWGRVLASSGTMADVNPLRYRGYYYDTETGFYYLQSRYYDPIVKRFLNADSYGSTGQGFLGYNMFAYCGNNPVNRDDPSGRIWINGIPTEPVACSDGEKNSYAPRKAKRSVVVFYYVRSDGHDFTSQATKNFAFSGYYTNIRTIPFNSMNDLIEGWNEMPETDDVFIFSHGTSDSLEFPDGSLEDMSQLSSSRISGTIYLLSCHGNGIANDLAVANNCSVVACDKTVSFSFDGYYSYPFAGGRCTNIILGNKFAWYKTMPNGQSTQLVGNCLWIQ